MPRNTFDYGERTGTRGRLRRILLVAAPVGVAAILAGSWLSFHAHHEKQLAQARTFAPEWMISGPSCPHTAPAEVGGNLVPDKVMVFDKVTFARRFGHADCRFVATQEGAGRRGFPVCQFTGPAVLEITTRRGTFKFAPGIGHPATVAVQGGQPTCVLSADFTISKLVRPSLDP